jgi:hypothetical protein
MQAAHMGGGLDELVSTYNRGSGTLWWLGNVHLVQGTEDLWWNLHLKWKFSVN